MIGGLSGVGVPSGAERVQRSAEKDVDKTAASLVESIPANADSSTLSAAALALARDVPPSGASGEQEAAANEREGDRPESRQNKRIDIRV